MIADNISLNPDVISEIGKHINYLSLKERLNFLEFVENLPEVKGFSDDKREEFLNRIFEDKVKQTRKMYESTVISGENIIDPRGFEFSYKLCLIHARAENLKIDKEKIGGRLARMIDKQSFGNLQSILPKNCFIWNPKNIAGQITAKYTHPTGIETVYRDIYCNDTETYQIIEYGDTNEYSRLYNYRNGEKIKKPEGPWVIMSNTTETMRLYTDKDSNFTEEIIPHILTY